LFGATAVASQWRFIKNNFEANRSPVSDVAYIHGWGD
jgi:hypothetical protein